MAAERWRHHEGKKSEKGHATFCGRTVCAIVLYLQRLRRNLVILSGGNPPRYETNHTNLRRSYGFGWVTCLGRWKMAYKKPGKSSALSLSGSLASTISVYERCRRDSRQGGGPRGYPRLGLGFASRLVILTVYGLSRLADRRVNKSTEDICIDQSCHLVIRLVLARLHVGLYFHGLSSLVCRCIRA